MATARNLPPTTADSSPGTVLADLAPAEAELSIRRFVATARRAGVRSVALDVLADSEAPYVARLRAFAKVERQLAASAVERQLAASAVKRQPATERRATRPTAGVHELGIRPVA